MDFWWLGIIIDHMVLSFDNKLIVIKYIVPNLDNIVLLDHKKMLGNPNSKQIVNRKSITMSEFFFYNYS